MKRIVLFVVTNLAVMLVLSVVVRVFGLDRALEANGLNLGALLVFSAVVGFTGAIISLLMSKSIAKWSTGAQVIDSPRDENQAWLLATVKRLADKAGIGMPQVAVYEGDANAFGTGAFRNSALVAVSSGLLGSMSRDELEAVLGHEIAHVANGDMVTMTLIQGVLNTFVVFLARVVAFFVDRIVFRTQRGTGPGYFLTVLVCQIVFGVLASIIVAWVSRRRGQRAVPGHSAADDACIGPIGRPACGTSAQIAERIRHHRQVGFWCLVCDASADRGADSRAAGARTGEHLDAGQ